MVAELQPDHSESVKTATIATDQIAAFQYEVVEHTAAAEFISSIEHGGTEAERAFSLEKQGGKEAERPNSPEILGGKGDSEKNVGSSTKSRSSGRNSGSQKKKR